MVNEPVKPEYKGPKKLIIGTRGSPLALYQSNLVKSLIEGLGYAIDIKLKIIETSGDWKPRHGEVKLDPLAGGKAQFAKEIEDALLVGEVDLAVHSMKDMETVLPDGLVIPWMLPREDARDAFLSNNAQNYTDLSVGSIVGTVSARRAAFLLDKRPDLKIVPFRGNVKTRIDKLRAGQVDATFLAYAGLKRLGFEGEVSSVISHMDMMPAVGQGAIGIELRRDDVSLLSVIGRISCFNTMVCVSCERGVLRSLGGGCHTPVGVHAVLNDGEVHLCVRIAMPDGSRIWERDARRGIQSLDAAIQFGEEIGAEMVVDIPKEVFSL